MGRCAYIKTDGTQCKKNAMSGFDFCNVHLETKVTKSNSIVGLNADNHFIFKHFFNCETFISKIIFG